MPDVMSLPEPPIAAGEATKYRCSAGACADRGPAGPSTHCGAAGPLMQRLPGCRDCLNHHGPRLRFEPRADDHHPVLVVIHMQGAVFVPAGRVFRFHLAIDAAPAADNTLDVVSRAGQADLEQALFG